MEKEKEGIKMQPEFYKNELEQMRKNYACTPLQDIDLRRPGWLDAYDPMMDIYAKARNFLQRGTIVYAGILQANSNLFRKFPPFDYPAQVVYSPSAYIAENPDWLYDITDKLYSYKDMDEEQIPDVWKPVVSVIASEVDRTDFAFTLAYGSCTVDYHLIPTIIFRKLLPEGKLCGRFLPVFTLPECKQVLILPKQYWTPSFTEAWVNGQI